VSVRAARFARPLLLVYGVLLAWALLWPTSTVQNAAVVRLVELVNQLHPPAGLVTYARGEVVMNALIIVPVSLLGSFVYPRIRWQAWTAYGFLASVAVELFQGLVLSGRHAAYSDVVANTAGILIGAVLYLAIRPMLRHRRRG
jgi:glycopeptide antibiotics resistance protein